MTLNFLDVNYSKISCSNYVFYTTLIQHFWCLGLDVVQHWTQSQSRILPKLQIQRSLCQYPFSSCTLHGDSSEKSYAVFMYFEFQLHL